MDWYDSLNKPPLTPPDYVFPIVWSILYLLIAISFSLYASAGGLQDYIGLVLFGLQLLLNIAWSPVFFQARQLGWSLVIILLMWGFILATLLRFYTTSPASAYLLVPYLVWVSLATYLNAYIWWNN